MNIRIIIIYGVLLLYACASESPYKPAHSGGYGYEETAISNQRFRVVFRARGDNKQVAQDFALLRAAQLTLEKGYDWFEIVDRDTEVVRSNRKNASQLSASRYASAPQKDCGLLGCASATHPLERPRQHMSMDLGDTRSRIETLLEIWMEKGVRPDSASAYSARDIVNFAGDAFLP